MMIRGPGRHAERNTAQPRGPVPVNINDPVDQAATFGARTVITYPFSAGSGDDGPREGNASSGGSMNALEVTGWVASAAL
jgi:hypothetical protein